MRRGRTTQKRRGAFVGVGFCFLVKRGVVKKGDLDEQEGFTGEHQKNPSRKGKKKRLKRGGHPRENRRPIYAGRGAGGDTNSVGELP